MAKVQRMTIFSVFGTASHRTEEIVCITTLSKCDKVLDKLEAQNPNGRYSMRPTEESDYSLI